MMLANYGVLSRAERNRIRVRVRNAMRAHARAGRWLGGRPPYGYRLVDAGPHPNPSKAASGARLHGLTPDPDTAPVVRRIFELYLSGLGFKAIATVLTNEGVLSPSAADPSRNSHRPGHAWAFSAVRAILLNPRYLGRYVFGRQARVEVLLDPDQPALGHVTRMRWQDRSQWLNATEFTHEPLVDEASWHRVQELMESNTRPSRRHHHAGGESRRSVPGRYPLSGLIVCGHCNKKLQGSHTRGRAYYRCRIGAGYPTGPTGHPASLAVREDRLLPHLDSWLVGLFAPDRVEEVARLVVEADAATTREDPVLTRARETLADCHRKLDRYLSALEAGLDPALVAARTVELQRRRDAAESVLASAPPAPPPLCLDEVTETLRALNRVPSLLAATVPQEPDGTLPGARCRPRVPPTWRP
jgi:site-specific DNA recombinase